MPHTGQKCPTSGLWQSDCTDSTEIALSKDELFPPCHTHGNVNWTLIRATQN